MFCSSTSKNACQTVQRLDICLYKIKTCYASPTGLGYAEDTENISIFGTGLRKKYEFLNVIAPLKKGATNTSFYLFFYDLILTWRFKELSV